MGDSILKDFLTLQFGIPLEMQMELIGYDNTIQARLKECLITELNVDLIETWVLKFKCPYLVIDELSKNEIINYNYNLVTEEKLIRLRINDSYAVFVTKEIDETEDGYKEITAYSREKMINKEIVLDKVTIQIKKDDLETGEGIFDKLEKSIRGWKLKYLDPNAKIEHTEGIRANKYRYFDSVQMSWIDFLKGGFREAFDTLILFDTYNKYIYCYDYKSYGQDTGIVINKKNIVNLASKKIDSKNMITKLYPTGSKIEAGSKTGSLSIESVCPYGSYIIDYTYVKPKMSKELQQALDTYDKEIQPLFVQWKSKNEEVVKLNIELGDLKNQRLQLNLKISAKKTELAVLAKDQSDTGKSATDLSSLESQLNSVESQIKSKETIINQKQGELSNITNSMQIENIISNGQRIFNDTLLDELEAYTYEGRLSNELHFKSESLYKWALEKIKDINKPDITFDLKECDFLDDVEGYKGFNQKISLGDWFWVEDERLGKEKVRLLGYTYNPDSKELNLKFSNKDKRNEYKGMTGAISRLDNTERNFNIKKTNWDLISEQKDFVKGIRENGLNAALAKVYSQSNKNKTEIIDSGIWISNAENPNRMIVLTSDVLVVSPDGLKTAKACITADGIIGEEIIGKIIAGERLYISNKNNNFIIDENGIRVDVNSFKIKSSKGENTLDGFLEFNAEAFTTAFKNADKELEGKFKQTAEELKVEMSQLKKDASLISTLQLTAEHLQLNFENNTEKMKSYLEQTAKCMTLKVEDLQKNSSSQIKVLSDVITSKVSEGDVSSIITQDSTSVRIAFNKISDKVVINDSGLTVIDGIIKGCHIIGAKFDGDRVSFGDIECQQLHTYGHSDLQQGCSVRQGLSVNTGSLGVSQGDIYASGTISCGGEKKCIQHTNNYGDVSFYSLEYGESYLGDMGFGQIINGECRIDLDPRIIESVNTDTYYHVFLSKYGKGDIWVEEMHRDYFIVKGEKDIRFSWDLKAKRRGHEKARLDEVFYAKPREFGGENLNNI